MAEHLAACSACAEWARRAERLDRLWEATCPAEPSPAAWDAVWANIAQALPCPAAARHEDLPASGSSPSRNGSGPKILVHPTLVPAPALAVPSRRSRFRGLATVALVGLAQAAAILVALGLAWRTPPHPDGPPMTRTDIVRKPAPAVAAAIRVAAPVKVEAEIQEGSLMVIRAEGAAARVVNATPPEMNYSSDGGLVILNAMESVATPRVAAR